MHLPLAIVIIVGAFLACGLLLVAAIPLHARLASRRDRARLRSMSITDLVLEARRCADTAGIRTRLPDARLFDDQSAWTRASLAEALDELHAVLAAEDRRSAQVGQESWEYLWHDFGLSSIREALDDHRSGATDATSNRSSDDRRGS